MSKQTDKKEPRQPKVKYDKTNEILWFGYPMERIIRTTDKGFNWIEENLLDKDKKPKPRYHNLDDFTIMEFNRILIIPAAKEDKKEETKGIDKPPMPF